MRPATLGELAERFDLFILDQYGVLHDGQRPYPGVQEALRRLRALGRPIVILSNSGKRSEPNERRMERLGFDRAAWDLFLTSGETARRLLLEGRLFPRMPASCHILSRDGDDSVVADLGIAVEPQAGRAEMILIAGSEAPQVSLASYAERLRPAAARQVPAICVNPDMTMLTPEGLAFSSGRIARLYEEMGGTVTWIGKPFPAIYAAAREAFPAAQRILCIGDSVEHDIQGAKRAGLAAALVRTGIHADEDEEGLEAEYRRHGTRPDYVLPALVWS